jgi:hypothetical protein|tara:strand:- start:60 stop:308 length:249 start_codon:yes stop_codon:yes gene_type:complete
MSQNKDMKKPKQRGKSNRFLRDFPILCLAFHFVWTLATDFPFLIRLAFLFSFAKENQANRIGKGIRPWERKSDVTWNSFSFM